MTAALAARCACTHNSPAFWKVHDAIFDNQDQITPDNAWEKIIEFAGQAGLDPSRFRACMSSPAAKSAVDANISDGKASGVSSTPTIFVDGRTIVGASQQLLDRFIQFDLHTQAHPPAPKSPD